MAVILQHSMSGAPRDELAARAATLKVAGVGLNEQVKRLREETGWPVTITYLKQQLLTTEIYHKQLKALEDGIIRRNVSEFKSYCAEMLPLTQQKLLELVKEGDIKAITLILKSVGIETPEQETKQAQVLQVIMPGQAKKEKDVGSN